MCIVMHLIIRKKYSAPCQIPDCLMFVIDLTFITVACFVVLKGFKTSLSHL